MPQQRTPAKSSKYYVPKEKNIGADYFIKSKPIIVQKMDKYMVELLEMDSI